MSTNWQVWAWSHVAVLTIGVTVGRLVGATLFPWWLGSVILGVVFTIQMTRQTLENDSRLSAEACKEWDRRLVWLGPLGVLWLLVSGTQDSNRLG